MGITVEKGIVVEWLKQETEAVTKGEPLFVVEADKVTTDVESPATGILAKIIVSVDVEVPILTVLAVILEPGENLPDEYMLPGDDTTVGDKSTATNVGLCDDSLTTKSTALFPKDFPRRRDMKYLQNLHKCPLDTREVSNEWRSGCFYTCRFFNRKLKDVDEIKRLYDELISKLLKKQRKEEKV